MMNVGTCWPLAANSSCVAASRTCATLPGADCSLVENTVWIESSTSSAGFSRSGLVEDALEARLGEQEERIVADAEPLAARLDLRLALLARGVEDGPDGAGEVRRGLQQQRRLADAGLAAEQDQRSGDDAAAEHAIELGEAGRDAVDGGQADVGVALRGGRPAGPQRRRRVARLGAAGRGRRRGALLDHRVPGAALGAAAQPLRRLGAAFLARVDGLRRLGRSHGSILADCRRLPDRHTRARCASRCGRAAPRESRRWSRRSRACRAARAPCWPTMTTSSPGSTSTSVTSIIIMSMQTAPTIGTRRPRTRTHAAVAAAGVDAVGVAGRHHGDRAAARRCGSASRS